MVSYVPGKRGAGATRLIVLDEEDWPKTPYVIIEPPTKVAKTKLICLLIATKTGLTAY
jgi:hypothetical protein